MTKQTKTLLLLGGIGIAYYLYSKNKASASMVQRPAVPGGQPSYVLPVGAPGGPGAYNPMSPNTQNLFNTLQTWMNQHPG